MAATDVKKKDPVLSWGKCVTCYRYASDYVQILGEVKERNFPRFKIVAIFIAPFRQRISRRKLEPALEKNQLCLISTKKIVCGVRYLVYISFFDYFNFPFCFFSSGETPDVFKLCRRDKSTLDRHTARRHPHKKLIVRPYNDKDEIVSKAREFANQWDKPATKEKKKVHVKPKPKPTPMKETPTLTKTDLLFFMFQRQPNIPSRSLCLPLIHSQFSKKTPRTTCSIRKLTR